MLCSFENWMCTLYQNYIDLNPCRCRRLDCGVYLQRLYRSRSHSHPELRFVVSHAVAAARNATANVITPLFHREWHIAAKGGRYSFAIPASGVVSTAGYSRSRSCNTLLYEWNCFCAVPKCNSHMWTDYSPYSLWIRDIMFIMHESREERVNEMMYKVHTFLGLSTLFHQRISLVLCNIHVSESTSLSSVLFRASSLFKVSWRRSEHPLTARNCIANTEELRAYVIRRNARITSVTSLSGRTIAAPALD